MNIDLLISRAAGVGASDLHLICGLPPQYRIDGALQPDPKLPPLTAQDCEDLAQQLAGLRFGRLENKGELDGSATIAGSRIRMNIFRQQEHFSMAIRLLADDGFLDSDEIGGAKKVLSAAAMTYVAAAFAAIAQLLRLVAIFGRRDD